MQVSWEGDFKIPECNFEVAVAGWVFNSYVTKEFVLGPHTIKVMCLQASSSE